MNTVLIRMFVNTVNSREHICTIHSNLITANHAMSLFLFEEKKLDGETQLI